MSTIPGLFVLGEANFSDHGANRLGASALMQGLADGYFVLPYTIGDYLATTKFEKLDTSHAAFRAVEAEVAANTKRLLAIKGKRIGGLLPPRAGQAHVGVLRHGAQRRGPEAGARQDPRAARGVLEGRERARRRRGVQPVAGEGRPRGRFPRAGRADVPGRAGARRILRRPLPRGVPDARTAKRCATTPNFCLRRRLGIHAARARPRRCTRSR